MSLALLQSDTNTNSPYMAVENHDVPFLMAVRYKQEIAHIWLWKIMVSLSLWQSDTYRNSPIYGCGKLFCPLPYGSKIQTGIHPYMAVQNHYVPFHMVLRNKQEVTDICLWEMIMSLALWQSDTNKNSPI